MSKSPDFFPSPIGVKGSTSVKSYIFTGIMSSRSLRSISDNPTFSSVVEIPSTL